MLILLLVLSLGIGQQPLTQDVDLIEVAHLIGENDTVSYSQVIMWEWSPDYRRMHVIHWRLLERLQDGPRRVGSHYEFKSRVEIDNRVTVVVFKSKMFRETESTKDPERMNKLRLEEKLRTGITRQRDRREQ